MKYIFNNLMIFGLIMLLTMGCGKDFLDRNSPGDLTYDKIYNTEADFEAALAGCYESIDRPATTNVYLGDVISDNVYVSRFQPTGDLPDFDKFTFSALNSTLSSYWSDNYRTIERVNMLIDKITNAEIDQKVSSRIIAEAKFLRAYSYFNLVRIFGGVPIHDKPVDINKVYDVPRSTAEEVLSLVTSDLKEAENIDSYRTPEQLAKAGGRASTVAAKTLLGKVFLWQHDFTNAEKTLGEIVEKSGSYGLGLEDLSVLYAPDQPINKEIIFSINYDRANGFGSPFVDYLIPYNTPPGIIYPNVTVTMGSGYGMIEPYIVAKFSSNDKRAGFIDSATFTILGMTDTNIYSLKYVDPLTTFNALSGANTIILRYADVLLMYAEALNENGKTSEAYQYINQVRSRAGIGNLPAGYSKTQMFQALADERQKEFLLEGDRWFDLRYRGIDFLKQTMDNFRSHAYLERDRNFQITDSYLLFPIPEDQIQVKSVLEQNPGY